MLLLQLWNGNIVKASFTKVRSILEVNSFEHLFKVKRAPQRAE